MSVFEKNINSIKKWNRVTADQLQESIPSEEVFIGDAYIEGQFLAVCRGDKLKVIGSTYSPAHEAERYIMQFETGMDPQNIVLYGFGSGSIVKALLERSAEFGRIIVFEPCIDLFLKLIHEKDLSNIFENDRLRLFLGNNDVSLFEEYLDQIIEDHNFRSYHYGCLSQYKQLFPESEENIRQRYLSILERKEADYNTMVHFGKSITKCEIHTFRYMMHAKNLYDLKSYINSDIPCILVAAGPSLEKNAEHLRKAKGKSFIICVDSAADYLASQGIMPDMICTVDSDKQGVCFANPILHSIPIAITTTSSYAQIDKIATPEVMYFSSQSIIHEKVFRELGVEMPCVYGGGSVALNIFEIALKLGFRTIIMIGQDLALTNNMAHAGKGGLVESDLHSYSLCQVDGYYGDPVITRSDFLFYIQWYNSRIPELTDITVVNATEGGAALKGTKQMPFEEAVKQYCISEFDFMTTYAQISYIIQNDEQKSLVYQMLEKHYKMLDNLKRDVVQARMDTDRACKHIDSGYVNSKELERINQKNTKILDRMALSDASDMLYRYMVQTENSLTDGLGRDDRSPLQETMILYSRIIRYMDELIDAIDYQLPEWTAVLDVIKKEL